MEQATAQYIDLTMHELLEAALERNEGVLSANGSLVRHR